MAAVALGVVGACNQERGGPAGLPPATGGAGGVGGGVANGNCAEEGAVKECHLDLGEHDGILNCFWGQQECIDGFWSECGGDARLVAVPSPAPEGRSSDSEGTSPMALTGGASATASGCTGDPCNPDCVGYEEDPPDITPPWDATSGFSYHGYPGSNVPGGFQGKQTCDDCYGGFTRKCNGNPNHYNQFDACQADTTCNTTSEECERNPLGWTWPTSVCSATDGPDMTAGYPCIYSPTQLTFPVCNRGNTAVPAGTTVEAVFANGNTYDWDDCNASGSQCTFNLAASLDPGACVQVLDVGPASAAAGEYLCSNWPNGNTVVYVGLPSGPNECGWGDEGSTGASQPSCANNWSDVKKNNVTATCELFADGGFDTQVLTETYTATCPVGTHPVWESLYWDSIIGCSPGGCNGTNQSSITFAVQTADSNAGPLTFAPATPETVATIMSSNPAVCTPATAPSGSCPVKLSGATGPNIIQHDTLQLTVTLAPSPDEQAAPTLNEWQITYTCVDAE